MWQPRQCPELSWRNAPCRRRYVVGHETNSQSDEEQLGNDLTGGDLLTFEGSCKCPLRGRWS